MVKHSLPQIHPEASTGVFARHLLKNDTGSVFQTRPKPNRNESDGEPSWQLIFVADGLNWWRKHHCQKDGGGVEPMNNWSKPQPSSKLYIWYLAIPCTHLVHFSVFVTRRRIVARSIPLAEDTLFLGVFPKGNWRATLGFKFMQPLLPGRRNSLFFAPSRTRLHPISQPVPSTKVENKNPLTHPEASSPKGRGRGAGSNQLTIGPNPNPRLNFTHLVSHDTLHTSCALFCFCHSEENFRKVDSFGRGYSLVLVVNLSL